MLTTMHWLPNRRAARRTSSGSRTAAELIETLSAPALQERPDVVQAADPAADGQRHEADLGRPPDHVPEDLALLVAGGDVEEDQLVGPLGVIPRRDLDRIARVAEVEEVRPLDHPAMVDVEARDDPLGQHTPFEPIAAHRPRPKANFTDSRKGTRPISSLCWNRKSRKLESEYPI